MNMGWVYSLNNRISPWVITWELPRFLVKFQELGRHELPWCGGDTSTCTSTAFKGCQTLFVYITLMWYEYGLGVQPQSPHFTMSYHLGVAQISDRIPKAWLAWVAVTWWEHIHMHLHSIQARRHNPGDLSCINLHSLVTFSEGHRLVSGLTSFLVVNCCFM